MKYNNKSFQERYEAWKNGADYWKDIRGINLGQQAQEEPSEEEQKKLDNQVTSILAEYNRGKGNQISVSPQQAYWNHMMKAGVDPIVAAGIAGNIQQESSFNHRASNGTHWGLVQTDKNLTDYIKKAYGDFSRDSQMNFISDMAMGTPRQIKHKMYNEVLSRSKAFRGEKYKTAQDAAKGWEIYFERSGGSGVDKRQRYASNIYNKYYHPIPTAAQLAEQNMQASPIIQNTPSIEQPQTINAAIPRTLLGPTTNQNSIDARNLMHHKMYEEITTPTLPNVLNLLPTNNFGKDAYGQKFWWRKGNNLHFDNGKDDRIAGTNPIKGDQQEINFLKKYNPNVNQYYHTKDNNGYHTFYDAGQLDDVVAKPSYFDKRLLNLSKKTFPNKGVRNAVYNTTSQLINDNDSNISFNDAMLNQVKLYLKSGAPGIVLSNNITRDFYTPYLNNLNLNKSNPGYIDELSHAFQYKHTNHPVFSTGVISEKVYDTPGATEHLAHGTIQPHLVDFIKTGNEKHLNKAKQKANKEYDKYGHWWWNKGKDKQSFNDWADKMSKYRREFDVKDPTYWYRGFYNENPEYAYSMLNESTDAHYNDHWKTPIHPTTSDQSYLTPLINAGRWGVFDNRDAYQEPFFDRSNPGKRFWYLNMNENNGVVPFDKYGNMWRLDGDLYGGVLPAVKVTGKRGKK